MNTHKKTRTELRVEKTQLKRQKQLYFFVNIVIPVVSTVIVPILFG